MLEFDYSEYVKSWTNPYEDDKETQDVVLVLWNKNDKYYRVWSLMKGILFSTDKYQEIKRFNNGAIIDGKIAVDDTGYKDDISTYKEICDCGVFYSEEKNDYKFLVNVDNTLFCHMDKDEEDENIVSCETDDYVYKYNIETGNLLCKEITHEYNVDWSDYSDVPYEGHSRLELGLDD